jgi:5'-nucleotidase
MANDLKKGTALNVNVPAVPADMIRGISITRQGVGRFKERFERRIDPRGNVYYWLTGETPVEGEVIDADANALIENRISITPISYDLTCTDEVSRLRAVPPPDIKV